MRIVVVTLTCIALLIGVVWAANDDHPVSPAVTLYLDADLGRRKNGAAKSLTALHEQQRRLGYVVVDVEPYVEDGDLEGFFVTYRHHSER